MIVKEETARIKINKLLEAAGWRFFTEGKLSPNYKALTKYMVMRQVFNFGLYLE